MFVEVAVNLPHVHGVFDYHIPEDLKESITLGQLITVPFGSRLALGIIIAERPQSDLDETRAIDDLSNELAVETVPAHDLVNDRIGHHGFKGGLPFEPKTIDRQRWFPVLGCIADSETRQEACRLGACGCQGNPGDRWSPVGVNFLYSRASDLAWATPG